VVHTINWLVSVLNLNASTNLMSRLGPLPLGNIGKVRVISFLFYPFRIVSNFVLRNDMTEQQDFWPLWMGAMYS
jgi:hypothetical protein